MNDLFLIFVIETVVPAGAAVFYCGYFIYLRGDSALIFLCTNARMHECAKNHIIFPKGIERKIWQCGGYNICLCEVKGLIVKQRSEDVIAKSPAQIDAMREAGRLSAQVLRQVSEAVRPGITTLELDELAETLIRDGGGIPAFKGYGGFPASICASVNDQIVHGIPSSKTVLKDGDIISIDTGAVVDGWVGDNAWTYPVGKISPAKKNLMKITEECLWAGIEAARAGNCLGDIGYAIQSIAEDAGYSVVREYVGHGVGTTMHEPPNVPNFGRRHRGMELIPGMVFAVEPIINEGTRKIRQMPDGWLACTRDGKPSAHFEHTIAVTEADPIILTAEPNHRRPV